MLAAAIFAFAMSALLLLFVNASFLDRSNRNLSTAASHAETAMEYLKSISFSTLRSNLCPSATWDLSPTLLVAPISPLISETITAVSNDCGTSNLLDITVTVSWKDKTESQTKTLPLRTIITG